MLKPLTVLIIEDVPDDAELIVLELQRGGYDPTWVRVETEEELRRSLGERDWDVILSDYMLPNFGATRALAIVKEMARDTPFIIVSGTIDDESAFNAMRSGVLDYVLKDHLSRLTPAVTRELREVVNRRALELAESSVVRLAAIVQSSDDSILSKTLDGIITSWNAGAEKMYGWTAAEAIGKPTTFIVAPERREELISITDRLRHGEVIRHFETVGLRKDGSRLDVSVSISPIKDSQGCLIGTSSIGRDITEQKRASAEIRRTTDLLKAVMDGTPDAVFVKDLKGRYLLFNQAASRYVGKPVEEVLGRDDTEVFGAEDARLVMQRDREVIEEGHSITKEEILTSAGATRTFLATKAPYFDGNGNIVGVIGISRDITKMKEADEALRIRDRAIQAVTQGIIITDPMQEDNPIIFASPGFERMTGYSPDEVLGRNCRFLQGEGTDPAAIEKLRQSIQSRRPTTVELLNYRKDGTPFWNELSLSPVFSPDGRLTHFVGVQTDVTDRRNLEEEFRQSQRMEAIGHLAGGVAHDFNNLLAIIIGYSSMLADLMPEDSPGAEFVEEIIKAGDRSMSLTRQLLAFSRKQVISPKVLDLNEVVRNTEKMLRRLIGEDVVLETRLQEDLMSVKADPGQIEQILMNLSVNARDAMPQGGILTIETENQILEGSDSSPHSEIQPGAYVALRVADTGVGMTEEVRRRLFEPFFTTKGAGKGTGLGLSVVHGIVKQHQGHIDVRSEAHKGTSFQILIPASQEGPARGQSGKPMEMLPRGSETLLLVEDESTLRAMTKRVLSGCGYTVFEAGNGEEAVELSHRIKGEIDLLLTDVVMPGMGGRLLAERLREEYPSLKVLYLSGYTDDAVVRHGVLQEQVNFLQKPFTPSTLAKKVREVLS